MAVRGELAVRGASKGPGRGGEDAQSVGTPTPLEAAVTCLPRPWSSVVGVQWEQPQDHSLPPGSLRPGCESRRTGSECGIGAPRPAELHRQVLQGLPVPKCPGPPSQARWRVGSRRASAFGKHVSSLCLKMVT